MNPYIDYSYAKNIYENGFTNGCYDYWETIAVAKWLRRIELKGKDAIRTKLYEFCEKYDPLFNRVTQRNQIRKIINIAMREKLNKYPDVTITEQELINIRKIKNFKYEKFLFSILVYSKRLKFQDLYEEKHRENIGYTIEKKFLLFIWNKIGAKITKNKLMRDHIVNLKQFIEVPNNGSPCKVLFSEDRSKPIIEIKGDDLVWEKFIEFEGGEFLYCKQCGEKELRTGNRQILCKKHSLEKEKSRQR